jgi:competence protein ComEA
MWTDQQRRVLWVLGLLGLAAVGVLAWQQRREELRLAAAPAPAQAAAWDRQLAAARRIDINAAPVAELERLPQVGPALARRIAAYRQAHGEFQRPEDLTRVEGIGPATYDALKDYVTVR